jgi:retinol dehydrogenase-12
MNAPDIPQAPDLVGRTAVVTGANTGIGRVTALELARMGAHVVLACRSQVKADPVIDAIRRETGNENVTFLALDLASLASVRRAAQELLERNHPIHLLINNAGLAGARGVTEDGFELTFGVNHLGHFLFTTLLLDRIRSSAPARIVTVASKAHYLAKGIDWDVLRRKTRTLTGMREYQVSKLANVLFSAELARREADTGITTYSLHPGVVASDIWRKIPWPIRPLVTARMISNEEGATTTLHCATSAAAGQESGLYYHKSALRPPNPLALDASLAGELWERSLSWV